MRLNFFFKLFYYYFVNCFDERGFVWSCYLDLCFVSCSLPQRQKFYIKYLLPEIAPLETLNDEIAKS